MVPRNIEDHLHFNSFGLLGSCSRNNLRGPLPRAKQIDKHRHMGTVVLMPNKTGPPKKTPCEKGRNVLQVHRRTSHAHLEKSCSKERDNTGLQALQAILGSPLRETCPRVVCDSHENTRDGDSASLLRGTFQFQHSKPVPTEARVDFASKAAALVRINDLDPQHGPTSGRQSKEHNSETESPDQKDPRGLSPSTIVRSFAARQVRATVKTHGVLGTAPTSSSTAQSVRPKDGRTAAK